MKIKYQELIQKMFHQMITNKSFTETTNNPFNHER
jgi:hypothetical protein